MKPWKANLAAELRLAIGDVDTESSHHRAISIIGSFIAISYPMNL